MFAAQNRLSSAPTASSTAILYSLFYSFLQYKFLKIFCFKSVQCPLDSCPPYGIHVLVHRWWFQRQHLSHFLLIIAQQKVIQHTALLVRCPVYHKPIISESAAYPPTFSSLDTIENVTAPESDMASNSRPEGAEQSFLELKKAKIWPDSPLIS
jgi:hypothetical protein